MKNTPNMQKPEPIGDIPPVTGSKTFNFTVSLFERQGTCHISFSENFPGYIKLAVALYSGPPPVNAQNWLWAKEATPGTSGVYDTGKPWGSGYSAALLGRSIPTDNWISIGVDTPVTGQS